MCCGGDAGGAPDWFYEASRDQIRQGIDARNEANTTYREFTQRGREMGSLANQDREADRFREDAYTTYGNAMRMRDANMASMGVNAGDPRFYRGTDREGVALAGQTAAGMNRARAGARQEGLSLETAGATGLAGNDPTGAIQSTGSMYRADADRNAQMQAGQAEGFGRAAGWALENSDKISGWFADGGYVHHYADGGYVRGIQRFAQGGNVYDRAQDEVQQMSKSMPAQDRPQGMDPVRAARTAKNLVDKAAKGFSKTSGAGPGTEMYGNAVQSMGGDGLGAMIDANGAWAGVDAAGGMGADAAMGIAGADAAGAGAGAGAVAGEAAGAALGAEAAGAAGAGAAGAGTAAAGAGATAAASAIGTAVPVLGAIMALGGALGLKDGGSVPRNGIGGRHMQGKAANPNGGKVSGRGGPKDDMVPAYLSPGEFVMPVGAVQKFGLDRLEKMRQAGLEFERQQGIA